MLGFTTAKIKKANPRKKVFDLASLPQPNESSVTMRGPLLGSYLRRLLQNPIGEGAQALDGWVLPSTLELSGFFHCSECDVLEAFHELQRSGYQYELKGLDSPVIMHSPSHNKQFGNSPWRQPMSFISPART